MTVTQNNKTYRAGVFALIAALVCGCGSPTRPQAQPQTDSTAPSGPTVITLDMKGAPVTVSPNITSQRQAQEALYGYMRKTLQALPPGIILDNTRYGGGGTAACDDRVDSENAPVDFADFRDMHTPPGIDYNDLIAKVGDIWKSWGWGVEEREDDNKPNRYGRSPDGYSLSIMGYTGQFAGYPPSMTGGTPCFSPNLKDDHVPRPTLITSDGLQYDEPSAEPTR